MRKFLYILLLALLLAVAGCGKKDQQQTNDEAITIYTTVYPLTYFTEQIGGDAVNVQSIYPAGADAHTFEPTQKDIMKLAEANLFIYMGLGLENFVESTKKAIQNEQLQFIATGELIPQNLLLKNTAHENEHEESDHQHGTVDPHVWTSPKKSIELATVIKDALVEQAPDQTELFEKNYSKLVKELKKIDTFYEEQFSQANNTTFYVSHAAFGYLAHDYGLTQVAIAGLNPQHEPSQKQLTSIVEQAKKENIQYVLFEQNISSKIADVIRNEIGAEALVVHNLSVLTQEDIKQGETLVTLMKKNGELFQQALQ